MRAKMYSKQVLRKIEKRFVSKTYDMKKNTIRKGNDFVLPNCKICI